MNFYVLTLFPELINFTCSTSVLGKAIEKEIFTVNTIDIRDFSMNKHRQVDDYPYGGGSGMVMKVEPVFRAYEYAKNLIGPEASFLTIYMSPQGEKWNQKNAVSYSKLENLIIICGHYQGIDERAIELINPVEISIGDFILTGGEIPAIALIDSISRNLKGVLGNEQSLTDETFNENRLEYPQYTRPYEFMGLEVPDILLSGHHQNIADWRKKQSLDRTRNKRPDLLGE